jgi:hypothetical protein
MPDTAKTTPLGRARDIWNGFEGTKFYEEAYSRGMSLSGYLETLDPSGDHTGDSAKIDAFGRVCRAANIVPKTDPVLGIRASTLDEISQDDKSRALVPEIVARAWRRAVHMTPQERIQLSSDFVPGSQMSPFAYPAVRYPLLQAAISVSDIVAFQTGIEGTAYRPFYMDDATAGRSRIAEATEIPAVVIKGRDKTIDLLKYGYRIDTSYEALRRMPIDQLAFHIQRIAIFTEAQKVDKVTDVLVNGDGNSGTAATVYNQSTLYTGAAAGLANFTLKAWLAFKMKFLNPFTLTTALANENVVLELMLLNAGTANIQLAMLPGLLGAQQISLMNRGLSDGVQVGWLASAPANKTVAFDKRIAIERVFEIGGTIQEIKRWVERQVESVVLSEVEGYGIIDANATKILNHAA